MPNIILQPNTPPWRKRLRTASFKGALFHVEQQGRSSGRRIVEHEYPRRDMPYAEDMGRHALRYQMTGYVIQYPANWRATDLAGRQAEMSRQDPKGFPVDYMLARDQLCAKLDNPSPGKLIDPYNPDLTYLTEYNGQEMLFYCERYAMSEARERGGVATFEMNFVEAGIPGNTSVTTNTAGTVQNSGSAMSSTVAEALNRALKALQ
jgi:prophage DNA circulation protein